MEKQGKKNMLSLSQPFEKFRSASLHDELLKMIPEDIFINQKKKIQEIKYTSERSSTLQLKEFKLDEIKEETTGPIKNENIILTFNENYKWDQANFDIEYLEGEEIPLISSEWEILNQTLRPNTGIELRNKIIKSQKLFDYQSWGIQANALVTLKGESSIWIFTRAPQVSHNNSSATPNVFNKHTSVIKIWKEDKCQRCFISFGIFIENETEAKKENGNDQELSKKIDFKTFSKRQLVNFTKEKNKNRFYYENDICELRIHLEDSAEEKIAVKIGRSFFLPLEQKSSIMLSGIGQSCVLKSLICKPMMKCYPLTITNDINSCECCTII